METVTARADATQRTKGKCRNSIEDERLVNHQRQRRKWVDDYEGFYRHNYTPKWSFIGQNSALSFQVFSNYLISSIPGTFFRCYPQLHRTLMYVFQVFQTFPSLVHTATVFLFYECLYLLHFHITSVSVCMLPSETEISRSPRLIQSPRSEAPRWRVTVSPGAYGGAVIGV